MLNEQIRLNHIAEQEIYFCYWKDNSHCINEVNDDYLFELADIVDQEVLVKENKIKHASSWLSYPVESIQAFFEQTIFTDEDDEIKCQIRDNWKSRLLN